MLVGQLLGLVGIFLLVAIFQAKDRKKIIRLSIVSCLTWSAYYMSMGAGTASGLLILGAVRCYVFEKFRSYQWIFGGMIAAYAVAMILTWKDWTSIMAFTAMILASLALWQTDPKYIRLISLSVTPFWLSYNLLNGSYMGAVADLITFSSLVVGIMRFDVPKTFWQRLYRRKPVEQIVTESGIIGT